MTAQTCQNFSAYYFPALLIFLLIHTLVLLYRPDTRNLHEGIRIIRCNKTLRVFVLDAQNIRLFINQRRK